jgi:hypothetical protein
MSFSATVRGAANFGPALRVTFGDWSGVTGDAAGTLSIGGKYMGSLWFKNDSTTATTLNMTNANSSQIFPVVNWDGNIPGTLTIQNQDNVGTGSFLVFSLGQ